MVKIQEMSTVQLYTATMKWRGWRQQSLLYIWSYEFCPLMAACMGFRGPFSTWGEMYKLAIKRNIFWRPYHSSISLLYFYYSWMLWQKGEDNRKRMHITSTDWELFKRGHCIDRCICIWSCFFSMTFTLPKKGIHSGFVMRR